eukprot:5710230-Pleurochrysis_carterae.AAC.1
MSMTQLLFDTAHVFDGSIDAIDGEMAEASVDKIFELPIELTNLPCRSRPCHSHRSPHKRRCQKRARGGVVCGAFAEADVVVIRKYKAQLVVQ